MTLSVAYSDNFNVILVDSDLGFVISTVYSSKEVLKINQKHPVTYNGSERVYLSVFKTLNFNRLLIETQKFTDSRIRG